MYILIGLILPILGLKGTIVLGMLCTWLGSWYFEVKDKQRYWEKRRVRHSKPVFFLGGVRLLPGSSPPERTIMDLYNKYPGERYYGTYSFTEPVLVVKDPELFNEIALVRHRAGDLPWTLGLDSTRAMEKPVRAFMERLQEGELELGAASQAFAADVLASAMLGVKLDSLQDPDALFGTAVRSIRRWQPWGFRLLSTNHLPAPGKVLDDCCRSSIRGGKLGEQAPGSFPTGVETVSALVTFLLYELGLNPVVQAKLREEFSHAERPSYEQLLGFKYLDMVVSEALRKWPPVFTIDGVARKLSGAETPEPVVCLLPIYALHHDPQHFENPERFDPERFREDRRQSIKPSTFLPFGVGVRSCFGSSCALIATKLLVVHLLKSFHIVEVGRTRKPPVLEQDTVHLRARGETWLGLERIAGS